MHDVSLGERLYRLCVLRSGRLPGLRFHDHAARAAVVIELASWGRVRPSDDGGLDIATTRTGRRAHDALLDYVAQHPHASLDTVLARAPVRMTDLLRDEDRADHRWYHRLARIDRALRERERERVEAAADGHADSSQTAALAMLADVLGVGAEVGPGSLIGDCADLAWIVTDCVAYLRRVRYRMEMASVVPGTAG